MDEFLSGSKLYGDDFNIEQILAWFDDEKEGYADLGAKVKNNYNYAYHALNQICGYNNLPKKKFNNVLGVGSAYGDELMPILGRLNNITILEPSGAFKNKNINGVPCLYVKPEASGEMPFENNQFDLITTLGVLHHIPNVSYVVSEIARCLSSDGVALIREPITSMGDWRRKRAGLTKRERGIPLDVFESIISNAGMVVLKRTYCVFPPLTVVARKLHIGLYGSRILVYLDILLSKLFFRNYKYHSKSFLDKFRPGSVYYVLGKKAL